jgi:hypothetical protein
VNVVAESTLLAANIG